MYIKTIPRALIPSISGIHNCSYIFNSSYRGLVVMMSGVIVPARTVRYQLPAERSSLQSLEQALLLIILMVS